MDVLSILGMYVLDCIISPLLLFWWVNFGFKGRLLDISKWVPKAIIYLYYQWYTEWEHSLNQSSHTLITLVESYSISNKTLHQRIVKVTLDLKVYTYTITIQYRIIQWYCFSFISYLEDHVFLRKFCKSFSFIKRHHF